MSEYGSYDRFVLNMANQDTPTGTPLALEVSAGGNNVIWTCWEPITVFEVRAFVTVAFNYDTQTAEGVLSFERRVAYGSDTGRVVIGAVSLTDGTAAGVSLYQTIDPVDFEIGDQLIADMSTAGTGGMSIAGDFIPVAIFHPRPETKAVAGTKMVAA